LPIRAATVAAGVALPLLAAALCYAQSYYVLPATRTVTVPTSYVVGSSYLWPTTYVSPTYYATAYYPTTYYSTDYYSTAYYPTSYYSTAYYPTTYYPTYYYPSAYYSTDAVSLAPTSYLATVYERRGLFGRRRWVVEQPLVAAYATSYVPTTYYVPTYYAARTYTPTVYESPSVWETAYVAAAPSICDELLSASPARSSPAAASSRAGGGGARRVESEAMEGPSISSDVTPVPSEPPAAGGAPGARAAEEAAKKQEQAAGGAQVTPPPVPRPLLGQERSTIPAAPSDAAKAAASKGTAGPATKKSGAPQAPADQNDAELEAAPGDNARGATRRDSLRPVYSPRPLTLSLRNVLNGRVETDSGQPREEVRLIVSSSTDGRIFHEGITDAFGRFAIRLGDGAWTVKVTMPSGRVYAVRQISVRDGRIIDNREGRDIPNLIIWY
jgi:hypothetical protein